MFPTSSASLLASFVNEKGEFKKKDVGTERKIERLKRKRERLDASEMRTTFD